MVEEYLTYKLSADTVVTEKVLDNDEQRTVLEYDNVGHLQYGWDDFYLNQFLKRIREEYLISLKPHTEYYGNVGDKILLELTYDSRYSFDSRWGTQFIHKFKDAEGHIFVWNTGNCLERLGADGVWRYVELSDKLTLKGSIKDHREYKGEKETVITRCRIVE